MMLNFTYRLRSGAFVGYLSTTDTVVLPKLSTVKFTELVDPPSVGLEHRKGHNLYRVEYGTDTCYVYTPVMKVYPDKDDLNKWFDNFPGLMLEYVSGT